MAPSLRSSLQSVGSISAGVFANVILAVPIDTVLHSVGVFPPAGEPMSHQGYLLAFSYRFIAAIAGGYATAALAPGSPDKHVIALGGMGVLLSSAGAAAMWDVGPAWYPLSLVAIAMPCSLMGYQLWDRRRSKSKKG